MLVFILQGIGLGFAAAVQPGPFQTYLISRTLETDVRRALPGCLAPLITDGPIIILMLFLLSQLPPWIESGLYLVSGFFILYLAWGAWRSWKKNEPANTAEDASRGRRQTLIKAVIMNAVSPGPYLYWGLVTGPILLKGWRSSVAEGISFLLSFYVAMLLSLVCIIMIFSMARHLGPRINRVMLGLSALVLLFFGIIQLYRGLLG